MAKIHVDILTPKYALFMKTLVTKLQENNELIITTRDYSELNDLIKSVGINAVVVGKHAADKRGKLKESLARSLELLKLYEGVDLALAQTAPETARVAYGLGVPYFMVHDSPHAEAQSRLSVPLASVVLTPFPVRTSHWKQYGAKEVIKYHSLDPLAWIGWASKLPLPKEVRGLGGGKGLVVVREEEYQASYLEGKRAGADAVASQLSEMGFDVVFIPRYGVNRDAGKATVLNSHPVMTPLLAAADAFIGAGGTMNAEAALLGTPAYSIYPGQPTDVEAYMIRMGIIRRVSPEDLLIHFQNAGAGIREEKGSFSAKMKRFRERLIDPTDFIADFVEERLAGKKA